MEETNWNTVRARFPACNRFTYLNAAGGAPMCAEASVEGKRYFDEMLLFGDTCWDDWLQRTDQVRDKLAQHTGASKEEIAFAPNTSMAMGMIAHLLKDGGDVLTLEDEFPSSTLPWLNLGFTLDYVPSEHGIYSVRAIGNSLRPEHRILVISYVQYKTGFRQDLAETARFCKSANLKLVVNATQAMGIFPLDVKENGIDFLVFSGLKWACAGYGAAGLYINRQYLQDAMPLAGWRSVQSPENMNNRLLRLKPEASVLEAGSPAFPAIFALGGALDLITRIGPEACMSRVLYLSGILENKLRANGFPVLYSFPEKHRSGIVMVKTGNARTLVAELSRKGILVSARGEGLRISVNIYNNEEDIERLTEALHEYRAVI